MRWLGLLLGVLLTGCSGCASQPEPRVEPFAQDDGPRWAKVLARSTVIVETQFHVTPNPPTTVPDLKAVVVSTGSGVVVESSLFASKVLTAAHVCAAESAAGKTVVGTELRSVRKQDGTQFPARVLYSSESDDVCILSVQGRAGDALAVATDLPPIGALVTYAGAPMGAFGPGLLIVDTARYGGMFLDKTDQRGFRTLYAGTSIGGASGSGLLYQGQIVSILLAVGDSGFPVYGSTLGGIRKAMHEVSDAGAR